MSYEDMSKAGSRLVPPVPNRANYIAWLRELVEELDDHDDIEVLDIGAGAWCIYPLLGASMCGWSFSASEVDEESAALARQTLALNPALSIRIHLYNTEPSLAFQAAVMEGREEGSGPGPLGRLVARVDEDRPGRRFAACMTNPPFYDLDEPIQSNERTVCVGSEVEMRTAGGEVGFLLAILADSRILRDRIGWFTCMTGKKDTERRLREALAREQGVVSVRSYRFTHGRTMRWGLAWSFRPSLVRALLDSATLSLSPAELEARVSQSLRENAVEGTSLCEAEAGRVLVYTGSLGPESVELRAERDEDRVYLRLRCSDRPRGRRLLDTLLQDLLRTNRRWRRRLAHNHL